MWREMSLYYTTFNNTGLINHRHGYSCSISVPTIWCVRRSTNYTVFRDANGYLKSVQLHENIKMYDIRNPLQCCVFISLLKVSIVHVINIIKIPILLSKDILDLKENVKTRCHTHKPKISYASQSDIAHIVLLECTYQYLQQILIKLFWRSNSFSPV